MRLRVLAVGVIALFAMAWRLVNAGAMVAPNLELVTATTVAAALLLPGSASWAVPVLVVATSDALIGNTAIHLFTWSAWGFTALAARLLTRLRRRNAVVLGSAFFGLGASTWFFGWTNFGVWAIGAGTYYQPTWDGLMTCYAAGLPFYRTMLLGNLILVPLVALGAFAVRERQGLSPNRSLDAPPLTKRLLPP